MRVYLEDNGRKINAWSTNKFSNELHTAVSVAFCVPSSVQNKKQNGEKLLLFIVLQRIQRKGEELMDRPIRNKNKEMLLKSEEKLEESGEIRSNEKFPTV